VIDTDSGAPMNWPTVNDTANVGAILAENTQVTEQDVTFGQTPLGAYMYTSRLVRVSYQLLQDSAFNLDEFLRDILGERIGRILNQHFTTGTGSDWLDDHCQLRRPGRSRLLDRSSLPQ
jgi:HK97 family phage major capsid protein